MTAPRTATEAMRTGSLVEKMLIFMAMGEARPFYIPDAGGGLLASRAPFERSRTIMYAGNDRYKLREGSNARQCRDVGSGASCRTGSHPARSCADDEQPVCGRRDSRARRMARTANPDRKRCAQSGRQR